MVNWNGNRGKRADGLTDPATNPGPKPGDFSLGSLESRAAARAMIEGKGKRKTIIRVQYVAPDGRVTGHKDYEIEESD